jgi:Flp pilus assembly protein TadG
MSAPVAHPVLPRASRERARGQALVEVAVVLPAFLMAFIGLLDLGTAVFSYNSLTNAAREGARLAIVNQDTARIVERAKSQVAVAEIADPSVSVGFYQQAADGTPDTGRRCSPAAVGCLAVVSFEATYHPFTPIISSILFQDGVTFTASSVLTVEYSCPNSTLNAAQCPRQP